MRTIRLAFALGCLGFVSATSFAAEGKTPIYAGGTVITQPGTYVLTRNISNAGLTPAIEIQAGRVELDLNGFTIDGGQNRAVLVNGGNDVKIRNGAITGADVGVDIVGMGGGHAILEDLRIVFTDSMGIRALGLEALTIRRVLVHLTFADGILVDGNGGLTQTRIESCQINRVGGAGIRVTGARGLHIIDNVISTTNLEGMRIDSVIGGLIRGNEVAVAGGTAGIDMTSVQGATVANNVVTQCRAHGIRVGNASADVHVLENISATNGTGAGPTFGDGIRVEGQRVVLEGNVTSDNRGVGLHLTATAGYCTVGRNRSSLNSNLAGSPCGGLPTLFPPNSCNNGVGDLGTFGDNLIPGPALF